MDFKRIIDETQSGMNVKTFLRKELLLSADLIRHTIEKKGLLKNGKMPYLSDKLQTGDKVEVSLQSGYGSSDLPSCDLELNILYEDQWMIAVDKPAFMLVHPLSFQENGTLANMIRHYQITQNQEYTIRPVSRLDRNTSGIVLFAKNSYIQHVLQIQSKTQLFQKEYLALTDGHLSAPFDRITTKIGRRPGSIIEHEVSDDGKDAITEYALIKQYKDFALVHIRLYTGRTHQIRVHMSSIGHPVTGDTLYGDKKTIKINRQCLHAHRIQFEHPITKKTVKIKSPLPKDIRENIRASLTSR